MGLGSQLFGKENYRPIKANFGLAQPAAELQLNEMQRLYNEGQLGGQYTRSGATMNGLQAMQDRAQAGVNQGVPVLNNARDFYRDYLGGNYNPQDFDQAKSMYGQATDQYNNAGNYYNDVMSGKYLNSNPYIDSVANTMGTRLAQGFNDIQRPKSDSQFAMAGRYGSGAAGREQGQIADKYFQDLSAQNSNLYYGNYMNERANQGQAAQGLQGVAAGLGSIGNDYNSMGQFDVNSKATMGMNAGNIYKNMYLPAQMLGSVGQQRDAYRAQQAGVPQAALQSYSAMLNPMLERFKSEMKLRSDDGTIGNALGFMGNVGSTIGSLGSLFG